MPQICMRQDFRAPAFGPASSREIYAAALEQYVWADRNGFDLLVLSEHHGVDDGWQPAPLTVAGVVLGMTERARVMISAVVLPLHDPVRIAEQIAVLDNVAPGRLWVVVGAGYRVPEFEMAGMEHAARGRILEEYVEVMKEAWTGEPFEWRGRTVVVTPKPASDPHPMVFVGGGVAAAARRAARLRLPMLPMNTDQSVRDAYYDEAKKVGYDGFLIAPTGPTFVHVAEDPDKAWAELGDYFFHEASTYASWQTEDISSAVHSYATTPDELRAEGIYQVLSPDQVVERVNEAGVAAFVNLHPLVGGMPIDEGWKCLQLYVDEVLPRVG